MQNRNGFDLSHVHSGTSKTGQLVPVLTKLIAPNSTISLGVQAEVNLPPLVAPFYGKIDFAIEGFVVPCSILYGGWKQFISNQESSQFPTNQAYIDSSLGGSNTTVVPDVGAAGVTYNSELGYEAPTMKKGFALPQFNLSTVAGSDVGSFRSLYATNDNIYDYMGLSFKNNSISGSDTTLNISLLPALAYHKICDVFYRNTKLTKTWFAVNPNIADYSAWNKKNVSLAWHSFYTSSNVNVNIGGDDHKASSALFTYSQELTFPDGVSVFSTRQRTYNRDYFTSAVASPQQGDAAKLQFYVDTSNEEGAFTVNALRMANSLQKFLETNNLSGDYADMVRNRWGVRPIDADFEEPHYLGRVVVPVYQHTVSTTATTANQPASGNTNPFTADTLIGSEAAKGKANGEGSICDNFNVSCWSYLMVIASLYPHAQYNYGFNRELTMVTLGDFPAPELQSVGMEEIKKYEIAGGVESNAGAWSGTFGYIPRYSRFKYMDDFSSGEMRPTKTLAQYQIQRSFSSIPSLGTDFVTIAQNALDNVLAVTTSEMNLSCWWEIYFKFHIVMPLADFCIPTLGELQDTHTIKSTVGGSRL